MSLDTLTTGIPNLDKGLSGGYPRGSVTAIIGSPHTRADRIGSMVVGEHPTSVLSFSRPPAILERDYELFHGSAEEFDVTLLDEADNVHNPIEEAFDDDMSEVVLLDGAEQLAEQPKPLTLARKIAELARETEKVVVLYIARPLDGLEDDLQTVLHLCDVVLSFELRGDESNPWLAFSKHRFEGTPSPLELLFEPHPHSPETNRIS